MRIGPAAAGIGIVGCGGLLGLTVFPYLVGPAPTVNTYYGVGIAGPPLLALFAGVCIVSLLAGIRERSDPVLIAGFSLVLGVFMVAIATSWALAVSPDLVGSFTSVDAFRHHRWAIVAATGLTVIGTAGYTWSVL